MSSLPLISHRLFVAAIANEASCPSKACAQDPAIAVAAPKATTIPLELLACDQPMPAAASRPLRANEATARR